MSKYRRIAKIYFEGQVYQYYRNINNRKMAFLKYDEDNDQYRYPTIEEIISLTYCFKNDKDFSYFRRRKKNRRHKLYRFVPKLIVGGTILTTLFYNDAHNLDIDLDYLKRVLDFQQENNTELEDYNKNVVDNKQELLVTNVVDNKIDVSENDDLNSGENLSYITIHNSDFFSIDEDINNRTVDYGDYIYDEESNLVLINNTEAFKKFNVKTNYTYEDMSELIDKSIRIDTEYKKIIDDFCNVMYNFYDDVEWTIFYNNLKTFKIVRVPSNELDERGGYATYNCKDNILYISENLNLEEDTLDIVIFRHELGHLFTESNFTTANNTFMCRYAKFQDEGEYIKEALNTIFTTEPFLSRYSDETQKNMGYALITNYLRTLIEIMPNFKIQQITWGNYEYFENKLDEAFDYNIDASTLISLLELQCNEYYHKELHGSEEDYREIYEYLGMAYAEYFQQKSISDDNVQMFIDTIDKRLSQGVDDTSLIYSDEVINEITNDFQTLLIK